MPYIDPRDRAVIDDEIDALIEKIKLVPREGALNYAITRIVAESLQPWAPHVEWTYADIATVVATFECAKLEFYRRIAGPKEGRSANENGDLAVYESAVNPKGEP